MDWIAAHMDWLLLAIACFGAGQMVGVCQQSRETKWWQDHANDCHERCDALWEKCQPKKAWAYWSGVDMNPTHKIRVADEDYDEE